MSIKIFPILFRKKFNHYFYELGVDVVIGSHPHVLQPMIYKNNHEREFLTVFSLGNFVSNQRDSRKDGGAMLRLSFEKKAQKYKYFKKRIPSYLGAQIFKKQPILL